MSEKNNGGPAFPVCITPDKLETEGMSLRDYFAAKAMQGELAAQDARHEGKGTGIYMPEGYADFAASCYRLADAMLQARSK